MSQPVVTATPETTIEECAKLMERHQIRRLPIVDGTGACCGIVTQADLARKAPRRMTAEIVSRVSRPTASASAVGA
jgi:CBS-domain-containing membrane protein